MVSFIDAHRSAYGVEPICAVLPIAPSTYYEAQARERDPSRLPPRAQRDAALRPAIRQTWEASRRRYGAKKVWKDLQRAGATVARCTVARLYKGMGLHGIVRGRRRRTTIPDVLAAPLPDLVHRNFTAMRPNQLWVSDLTYVATWRGFVYVAFVTMPFHGASSAGGRRPPCARTSRSTPWSRRCTTATSMARSCITATAARNISPSATRIACSSPASTPR